MASSFQDRDHRPTSSRIQATTDRLNLSDPLPRLVPRIFRAVALLLNRCAILLTAHASRAGRASYVVSALGRLASTASRLFDAGPGLFDRRNGRRTFLLVLGLYVAVNLVAGSMLSWAFDRYGWADDFLPITQPGEFTLAAFGAIILQPVVWSAYVWQPKGIAQVLHQLYDEGIVVERPPAGDLGTFSAGTFEVFLRGIGTSTAWRWWNGFSQIFTLVTIAHWHLSTFRNDDIALIDNPFSHGRNDMWFHLTPAYYWPIWIPLTFIAVYMCLGIIARTCYAVVLFRRLLGEFNVVPKPFHPDGLNGFSELGGYVRRSVAAPAVVAAWLLLLLFYPMMVDDDASLDVGSVMFIVPALFYLILPIYLARPIWQAHDAMSRAKRGVLLALADDLEILLAAARRSPSDSSIKALNQSISVYRTIDESYHTWPFRLRSAVGFAAFYSLPAVSLGVTTGVLGNVVYAIINRLS